MSNYERENNDPFIVDQITTICNGCMREIIYPIDPHFYSAPELINWMKTVPKSCSCGATTCDVKARMKKPS